MVLKVCVKVLRGDCGEDGGVVLCCGGWDEG